MTHEQKQLLLRALELTEEFESLEPPPEWKSWLVEQWTEERDHGPRYLCGHWFGSMRERDRMRYRRAIDVLESQGLVETWRCWGTRLTNLKLTDAGRALVDKLRLEALSDG